MIKLLIVLILVLLGLEAFRIAVCNSLSKRYFRKSRDTRGSPYYRGQAPFLVVTERGRQKAYYKQPSWFRPEPKKQRRFGWVLKLWRLVCRDGAKTAASR